MDHDDLDLNAWRQVCLGDEPIYCAAPSPSNSDDIICLGSDDGLDDDAKITKRLRYEEQGLRYLRGEPLRILSASLRGPFDEASGWQNPWLPKAPATKSLAEPTRIPTKPLPAVKRSLRKNFEELRQRDETTPSTGNSMRCYLPSPDSHRDLPLFSSMETEKRGRIQAWATEVSSGLLERDDFWAPNEIVDEQTSDPSRKRPAGKEWLKTKPSKRKRPDDSQSTAAASTPTPFPPAQTSMRSVSMPNPTTQTKRSSLHTESASRSFELITPSSSTDQGATEPAKEKARPPRYRSALSQDEFPSASRSASSGPGEKLVDTVVGDIPKQPSPGSSQTGQQVSSDPETQDHPKQASNCAIKEEVREDQEAEGGPPFETCQDNSFYYRSRLTRQATPPIANRDIPANSNYAEPTQTGTPVSSTQKDVIAISTKPPAEQTQHGSYQTALVSEQHIPTCSRTPSQSLEATPQSGSQNDKSTIQDDGEVYSPTVSPAKQLFCGHRKIENDEGHLPDRNGADHCATLTETNSPNHSVDHTNSMEVAATTLSILPTDTKPVKEKHRAGITELDMAQINQPENVALGQPTAVRTHPADPEPLVDEGSTLIGDIMDVDEATLLKTGRSSSNYHSTEDPDGTSIEANPVAGLICPPQGLANHGMQESDTESDPVIVPLSQLDWGVAEAINGSPVKPSIVTECKPKIPGVKVESTAEDEEQITQPIQIQPSQSVERQSPWVPDVLQTGDLGVEHIKSEPIEDVPSPSPYPAQITLMGSRASDYGASGIRPSQQSPWAPELVAPLRANTPSTPTAYGTPRRATASPGVRHTSQAEIDTRTTSSPCRLSSSAPLLGCNGQMLNPRVRPSTPGSESECQASKQSALEPFTTPAPGVRPFTPEPEVSIKSFAKFNNSSPQYQQPRLSNTRCSSTGQVRSILSSAKRSNPWGSAQSSRRVSFAPLPNEEDGSHVLSSPSVTRAASPPPQASVDIGDEDMGGHFQNHFDAVKRRTSGENGWLRLRPRLLPSSSQQKPVSPAINAMAETFREADAYMARHERPQLDEIVNNADGEHPDEEIADRAQSPWQSTSQGVDDVAAVLGNLNEFLDAWDVDAEMNKARLESSGEGQGQKNRWESSGGDMDALLGFNGWS
ncbi:hypothetical protein F4779DRAFT_589324 [Xylariaceae sp. FL0662B]|nr:hypothetical protein F4779DRAFT_589324 [Xylariaceae sp. FL0662B]